MEAAAKLPFNIDDRVDESDIDWNKCVVCQESKFPKKKFPHLKRTSAGISRVLHCAGIRKRLPNETYSNRRLEIVYSLEKNGSQDVF